MATMNISLPDPMREWVEARVARGEYASASDYVRDLIRHDREEEEARAALIAAVIEGEESGLSERRIPDIIADRRRARGDG